MAKRAKKPAFIEERPTKSLLDEQGREIVDSRPIAASLGIKREPTLAERIKATVRSEYLAHQAKLQGHETFEEADDFEVGDDYDPTSPYENEFDPEPGPRPQAAPPQAEQPQSATPAGEPLEPTPPPSGGSAKR